MHSCQEMIDNKAGCFEWSRPHHMLIYIDIRICMHACMHVCMYVYIYMYFLSIYIYIYIYVHTYIIYIYICICIYICVYIYVWHMHMYIYVHISTHTSACMCPSVVAFHAWFVLAVGFLASYVFDYVCVWFSMQPWATRVCRLSCLVGVCRRLLALWVFDSEYVESSATSVWGLKLLVYAALRYYCMRP